MVVVTGVVVGPQHDPSISPQCETLAQRRAVHNLPVGAVSVPAQTVLPFPAFVGSAVCRRCGEREGKVRAQRLVCHMMVVMVMMVSMQQAAA